MCRDATVRFGPVRRPFSPNPEPEPGPVRALRPNPEPRWGPVRFRSSSGLVAIRTWTEPRTPIFALFAYVIIPKWHIEPVVYRKCVKRRFVVEFKKEVSLTPILQLSSAKFYGHYPPRCRLVIVAVKGRRHRRHRCCAVIMTSHLRPAACPHRCGAFSGQLWGTGNGQTCLYDGERGDIPPPREIDPKVGAGS